MFESCRAHHKPNLSSSSRRCLPDFKLVSVGLSKGQKTRPRIARCTISGGMWNQKWARLLAYVSGSVNRELLPRNEYLAAENSVF